MFGKDPDKKGEHIVFSSTNVDRITVPQLLKLNLTKVSRMRHV